MRTDAAGAAGPDGELRDPRRALPGVDRLLALPRVRGWAERWGEGPVKAALRAVLAEERSRLAGEAASEAGAAARGGAGEGDGTAGGPARGARPEDLLDRAERRLERRDRPSLRRVLNGTGVVLHTNLGRAPLAPEAVEAAAAAAGYGNVEYDLETGERGSRHDHCAALLRELTGAEGALVVNNNAAAVALAVNELAAGREVVVSRGELVEIGGSFRIPEVVARAGGALREVGTTNRTREEDYERALGPETGLLLKVHPSNYRMRGFVSTVGLEALVGLGRRHGVPVLHDLGSGLLLPDALPGFPPEPPVRRSVESGADLVTWSGDKLLGGPQAGLVLGRAEAIARLRRNPLLRTFRVGKLTLAALEATLRLYRDPARAAERVPALRSLREPAGSVEARARAALRDLAVPPGVSVAVEGSRAVVGGGSFPDFELESAAWAVRGVPPDAVEARCRAGDPPLVGRVAGGAFLVDVRTLLPGEEGEAARVLASALAALAGARGTDGSAGGSP